MTHFAQTKSNKQTKILNKDRFKTLINGLTLFLLYSLVVFAQSKTQRILTIPLRYSLLPSQLFGKRDTSCAKQKISAELNKKRRTYLANCEYFRDSFREIRKKMKVKKRIVHKHLLEIKLKNFIHSSFWKELKSHTLI